MNPDARVWRVYLDESGQFDLDMVEGIKDTVDVMLVSLIVILVLIVSHLSNLFLRLVSSP